MNQPFHIVAVNFYHTPLQLFQLFIHCKVNVIHIKKMKIRYFVCTLINQLHMKFCPFPAEMVAVGFESDSSMSSLQLSEKWETHEY